VLKLPGAGLYLIGPVMGPQNKICELIMHLESGGT
jgi:hypothetical protein